MITEILLFFVILALLFPYVRKTNHYKLPPGPTGIPFLGTPPSTKCEDIVELNKKYGEIFMTSFGCQRFIWVTDFKMSKELFSKLEFSDRPAWNSVRIFDGELERNKAAGVTFGCGVNWLHTRRFLLRHLRDRGMGKSRIEGLILGEIEYMIKDFKLKVGEPTLPPFSIYVTILNIIWQLVASRRYEHSDRAVKDTLQDIEDVQDAVYEAALPDFFPILKKILPKTLLYILGKRSIYSSCSKNFSELIQPLMEEHLKDLDPENPRDIIDEYLIEMKFKNTKELNFFDMIEFYRGTFDIFLAGSDTTTNMTKWCLFYFIKYPQYQKKVQDLIDEHVPSDRHPNLMDRDKLVFLDSFINEVQRYTSLLPFGVARTTTADMKAAGYDIPKNSMVIGVSGIMHRDPKYWKNPDEFDPYRFIDANGKHITSCDGFEPFGIGKRQCLGEQFARMELYLILSALLQTFTFEPEKGKEVDLRPVYSVFIYKPNRDQKMVIKLRK